MGVLQRHLAPARRYCARQVCACVGLIARKTNSYRLYLNRWCRNGGGGSRYNQRRHQVVLNPIIIRRIAMHSVIGGPRQVLVACAVLVLAGQAQAQNYPARPVRMIVPFSPGGAADVPGRMLMQKLTEALGQQVVVDNRPGAGGTLGAGLAAKAAGDGYTLLMISNTHVISASLYKKLPYDSLNDFAPVLQFGDAPNVLVVHPALPVKSVRELVALAKAKPGSIDFASSGNGRSRHLFAALFTSLAGVKMTHIPYKGSAQATTDLLAGQVTVSFPGIAGMIQHIRNGRLRALAVTSAKRSPQMPDVPSIAEAGVKGS